MKNRKIGVLMGGASCEKPVSLDYGQAILGALWERGYNASAVFVDRDLDLVLRQGEIDVAFLALSGRYGGDGCLQGMLELMGIPYTGSDVLSSALAMNRARSKELFLLRNLPTASYYIVRQDELGRVNQLHGDLGFPAVVKPVALGSSARVHLVNDLPQLAPACEAVAQFGGEGVIVERLIRGQEISVAVLGGRALGAVEIASGKSEQRHFYNFASTSDSSAPHFFIPPRVSPQRYRGILAQAERAHEALGCTGATQVDMVLSEACNEYIVQVNTLPGLMPSSLLPKIAHASGLRFEDLVEAILGGARLSAADRGSFDRGRPPRHTLDNNQQVCDQAVRH